MFLLCLPTKTTWGFEFLTGELSAWCFTFVGKCQEWLPQQLVDVSDSLAFLWLWQEIVSPAWKSSTLEYPVLDKLLLFLFGKVAHARPLLTSRCASHVLFLQWFPPLGSSVWSRNIAKLPGTSNNPRSTMKTGIYEAVLCEVPQVSILYSWM